MIWQLVDTSSVGGIERHIETLVAGFQKLEMPCRVVLYQDHGQNPWIKQLTAVDADVMFLDGTLAGLSARLKQDRPALVHTHGYKAGILGRFVARRHGVPVVHTFHSGEDPEFPLSAYFLADRWSSVLNNQRVAVSEVIQRKLPFSSTLIPNFIRVPDACPPTKTGHQVSFAGRLSHEKAPDLFCEMAARHPQFQWNVFGDGPMREELENRYAETVTFHGLVTDMEEAWAKTDLLFMPSRFEGLPLAALEAISRGIPILASQVGGLPTVIEHGKNGWMFPSENLERASESLVIWSKLAPDDRGALTKRAWSHAHANFSEQAGMKLLLQVYESAGISR